jgi:hypothetical protein
VADQNTPEPATFSFTLTPMIVPIRSVETDAKLRRLGASVSELIVSGECLECGQPLAKLHLVDGQGLSVARNNWQSRFLGLVYPISSPESCL